LAIQTTVDIDKLDTLADLAIGETGIVKFYDENAMTTLILNLGLLPDTAVQMVRRSPFGGAFYIRTAKQQVAIRVEEARGIFILKQ